jgi:hypothetical protein
MLTLTSALRCSLDFMAHLNSHYLKLKAGYHFEIGRRVKTFTDANPRPPGV